MAYRAFDKENQPCGEEKKWDNKTIIIIVMLQKVMITDPGKQTTLETQYWGKIVHFAATGTSEWAQWHNFASM